MKIQKLLVPGALGLGLLFAANVPVMAKGAGHTGAGHTGAAHKGGMAKQLGLSKDQKSQLKPILKDAKEQIKAVKADTTLSKKERHSRIKAIRADSQSKVNAILTSDQQQKLTQLRAARREQKRAAKGKA
jgi:Spy/CpxP family protein refolding chaperone